MRYSLTLKLIFAFLVVSLAGTALVAFLAGRTTSTEFDRFRLEQDRDAFLARATDYYLTAGSWTGVADQMRLGLPPQPGDNPPPPRPNSPIPFALVDTNGQVVVPNPEHHRGDYVTDGELSRGTAVEVAGQRVGTILDPSVAPRNPAEAQYVARINNAILIAALSAMALALLLAIILARTLTRPLHELTEATQAMNRGQLDQRVPVRSKDELGRLAAAFNQMSADLSESNRLRQQMTADIAHDLRSPLAVIAGYTEGLRDGVLSPKSAIFETMHREMGYLQQLVEDLRILSLADANALPLNRVPIEPRTLLADTAAAFQHQAKQKQVRLGVIDGPALPLITVDPERMSRVLGNLVSNALRYTPAGGQITLTADAQNGAVILNVQDSGSGIEPDQLPHIFDRFYRADEARQQDSGESGLGLAIAKSIVEAHGGTITAASQVGEGTTFSIWLDG
ncbi:MAG: HAMP domain-containing protein [Anaerolineae bacterium]|nr:HAMP domain-containing protein [Anaerolineae bacterium]MCB9105255.1 HAMP domain-containing protein [Anaerolineales bacterium]